MGRLARPTVSNGGAGNTISAKKTSSPIGASSSPAIRSGRSCSGRTGRRGLYVPVARARASPRRVTPVSSAVRCANTQMPFNPRGAGEPRAARCEARTSERAVTRRACPAIVRWTRTPARPSPGTPTSVATHLNHRRIVGYGLRNPFRFTFAAWAAAWARRRGLERHEEESTNTPDPDVAPRNFGWPCYEGTAQQAAYWNASGGGVPYDPALCTNLSGQVSPVHRYLHTAEGVNGDGCGTGSSAIAGITFLRDDTEYPDSYDGGLFWTDYNPSASGSPRAARTADPTSRCGRGSPTCAAPTTASPTGPPCSWAPPPPATCCTRTSIAARSARCASTHRCPAVGGVHRHAHLRDSRRSR